MWFEGLDVGMEVPEGFGFIRESLEPSSLVERRAWILIGVLLIALNLRLAIGSVLPVLETIRTDLGLGHAGVSFLVTVPVVCMGIFALLAAPLSDRLGRGRVILWAVVLVGLATTARLWGMNTLVLFGSTILVGIGIAISQTLLPSVVSEFFEDRAATVTGLYTAFVIAGAGLASFTTVELTNIFGDWPASLAAWGMMALPALFVWQPVVSRTSIPAQPDSIASPIELPWKSRWAWFLSLYYGVAAALFFASLTWLAPRYTELGWNISQTGFLVTVLIAAQLVGALAISAVGDFTTDRRPWFALCWGCLVIGFGAIGLHPLSLPWIWTTLLGFGDGGLFALVLTLPVDYSSSPEATDRLSSLVLCGGYTVGAFGPPATGWLRGLTGAYSMPFLMLAGLSLVMIFVAVLLRPDAELEVG